MLGFIKEYTQSGEEWEKLINRCYRLRYQNEGYQEIPALYKGDGGIEGFTNTGIVYQCYCPEKEYSDDDLYKHFREKMHRDIGKFISTDYEQVLMKMGVHDVHEWHFVIPEYKDKRILEYKTKQEERVLEYKQNNPKKCSYIANDFKIYIKVAEDFIPEISRLTRPNKLYEIDLKLSDKSVIKWEECSSPKVENIRRKIKAVMNGVDDNDSDYKDVVGVYLKAYILGVIHMDEIRREDGDLYEQILKLKQSYKRRIEIRTKIQCDHSMNQQVFLDIMDEFAKTLEDKFHFLTQESREDLLYDIIGEWLADCPMQFKM